MSETKNCEVRTRIILFDGFEILHDSMNYTVAYNTGKKDKDGSIKYKYLSYNGTLESALIACRKKYISRQIRMHDVMPLEEAISIIVRSTNHFESLIKEAFNGAKT